MTSDSQAGSFRASTVEKEASAARRAPRRFNGETVGLFLAISSALFYVGSLSLVRAMTDYPDVSRDWTLAIKELATVLCSGGFILIQTLRGKYRFPKASVVWTLIGAGLFCEALGARAHLATYAMIGLALATPAVQALQLILSSLIGAFWLKERVTTARFVALALLLGATALLCGGSLAFQTEEIAGVPMRWGLGFVLAFCTALGYALQLAMMRRVLRDKAPDVAETSVSDRDYAPTSLAMLTVCGVGVLVFGGFLTAERGLSGWTEAPWKCWLIVIGAGVLNMLGFVFQIESLRRLFVLKQTLIASAQTVVLTLVGVFCFNESMSLTTGIGVALVAAGAIVAGISKN